MSFCRALTPVVVGSLLLWSASLSMAEDDENSRSVRIIDGPANPAPVPAPPPASSPVPSSPASTTEPSPSMPSAPLPSAAVPVAPSPLAVQPKPDLLPDSTSGAIAVVSNPADLTLEMLPDETVAVGSRVAFRISAKKPGYLILVDVDSNGRLTQIYPNPASLMAGHGKPNSNYLRPGKPVQIPSAAEPYMGFEFVISPPAGAAMVVAILSDQPVQMVELPDIPIALVGQKQAVGFLSKLASELRVPSGRDEPRLRQPNWSMSARFYQIKQASD